MKARIETFDIWDTCLVRATGAPRSIFRIAAREVLRGGKPGELAALMNQRIEAETEARKSVPGGECNLSEIETALARTAGPMVASAFIATELRIERDSVRPVARTLEEVKRARASGATVAFASDMYLPESFLRELLEAHGFAASGDRVFVSGDRRANKHSGALFKAIGKELQVRSADWTHHGDNPRADIEAARRLGIEAVEFRQADWTVAEEHALKGGRPHAERIAGAMRAARLSVDPSIPHERAGFLAGVAAPWLVALTTRMLAMARREGVRRLFFVARDGEIPLRLARIIEPQDIECRYLFGSRKAWCFPAMVDLSEACTSWLRLAPMRPDTLLASLGFPMQERDGILRRCGMSGDDRNRRRSQEELAAIWSDIRAHKLESAIVRRAATAREPCTAYLKSQKLLDDVPWAIADVGWSLHGQAALKRILAGAGAAQQPRGLYFMTRRDRRPESETGLAHSWLVEENSADGELIAWMSPVIEECFLTSSDLSVTGYKSTGTIAAPAHATGTATPETTRHAAELRLFAESLMRELLPDLRDGGFATEFEDSALAGLVRFLREPDPSEIAALHGLQHATAPGAPTDDTQPLVRPYSPSDALGILLRRAGFKQPDPERQPYWHAGSMAASPRIARAGMKAALAPNPLRSLLRKSS